MLTVYCRLFKETKQHDYEALIATPQAIRDLTIKAYQFNQNSTERSIDFQQSNKRKESLLETGQFVKFESGEWFQLIKGKRLIRIRFKHIIDNIQG